MNTKLLEELMQRKISRREFLAYVGAGILALTGINALLKSFVNKQSKQGYGGGPYGGVK